MKTVRPLRYLDVFRFFAVTVLLLAHVCVFGQYPSNGSGFEVNYIKGCAPLSITITDTIPATSPKIYKFDWNGSLKGITVYPNPIQDTTYEKPGVYTILQVTDGGDTSTIKITVLEPLPPTFKVYNCIDNSVYVDVSKETYYDQLKIDYGDASLSDTVTVKNMPGVVHPYASAGTYQVKVEGIFENASTNCSVDSMRITTLDQDSLEVAQVNQLSVLDQHRVQVDYQLPNPGIAYQLQLSRNGDTDFSFAAYDLAGNSTSFIIEDSTLDTRRDYFCFHIAAVDFCNDSQLNSDTICSIALQATAGNLENDLSWQTDTADFSSYQVLRDSSQIATTASTIYADSNVVCRQSYAYQVTAQKGGIKSLSEMLTLTAMSQDTLAAIDTFSVKVQGLGIALQWKAVPEAQQYYIYREGNGLPVQLLDSVATGNTYVDQQVETDIDYCYQITYVDACGNESSLSTQFCDRIPKQAQIVFPNAFTPNGDGLNDVFLYKANLIERIELQIFNRWGALVFSTDQIDMGWDGTFRGAPAPQGTYVFQAKITDQLGNRFQQRGSFTLLIP